ncbi:hypothetical protein KUTeg_002346 [Tegillarca granosa]|uniref:peptidylprolyl isomerase n=1 Tax=Tegillarca granosa TaxID=220873 RepID=A0ABQ9FU47_TEGGR|nr:hypothetical protein KUTeg_002346 [Tegillarca granosa]
MAVDLIKVHVVSYFEDGQKFDSTYDRDEPLLIQLGMGQVIKGLEKGLLDMCAGEKRKLTIPPRYAYGSKDMLAPNGKLKL